MTNRKNKSVLVFSAIAGSIIASSPAHGREPVDEAKFFSSSDPITTAGMLGMVLWLVETRPLDREVMAKTLQAHLRYQLDLEKRGIMFAAGPLVADDSVEFKGPGLIVIRAGSAAEARQIADADPMHKSGGRTYTLRKWIVNEGSITIRIPFSRYNSPEVR